MSVPAERDQPASEHPALSELQDRLADEERAYAEVLGAIDALAGFELPAEAARGTAEQLAALNQLWSKAPAPAPGGGLGGALRRRAFAALAPALERQAEFNAVLVQLLNARLAESDRLHARLRELASALVHYAQRVQPLVDAHARAGAALATTRSELVLDSFGRQLESHARRLDGLSALGERLDRLAAELAALRTSR